MEMKSAHIASGFSFQRVCIVLIALATFLAGSGQPALASIQDRYQSWSYYADGANNYVSDDHSWKMPESAWQGSSAVGYDGNNFATSSVGFDSHGSLVAKVGVSVDDTLNRVHTESSYRDDGFQCGADSCGTAVPLGSSFSMRLKQDGSFTAGSPNYSLGYTLRTVSTAYNFHFAVQQGEGPLAPYGWFSTENLGTGATTMKNIESDPSFFNLVWEDDDHDGIYNFSYDVSFSGNTDGTAFGEELSVQAYAHASGSDPQFFDSLNSFYATVTNQNAAGGFYRGNQLIGTAAVAPEPVSSALFLFGGGMLALRRYRRKKS